MDGTRPLRGTNYQNLLHQLLVGEVLAAEYSYAGGVTCSLVVDEADFITLVQQNLYGFYTNLTFCASTTVPTSRST